MSSTANITAKTPNIDSSVKHRQIEIDGIDTFYREAGPDDAPVVLLPHGYPSSSFQYRHFMPALADWWRLIAPDFPGFGYSGTPDRAEFAYTFDGYADFLDRFATALGLTRYALYLHDYGSQIGLRLAIEAPERIAALIIQNGDIYEDELGSKYDGLKDYWANPTAKGREKLSEAVSEEGFRDEFLNEVSDHLVERISPDLWRLSWPLMQAPERREIAIGLMEGLQANLDWFPRYQAYLREHRPPTLIAWGPQDGYMPEGAAHTYRRDVPDAELHLLDGGHWALETNLDEVVTPARDFLGRVHAQIRQRPRRHVTHSGRTSDSFTRRTQALQKENRIAMSTESIKPRIARIWRGRTTSERADEYAAYLRETGFPPLVEHALWAQMFREDRGGESEFVTISYWESIEAMSRFAGDDPRRIHHLPRDPEFLIELPEGVQVLDIVASDGHAGAEVP